MPTKKKTKISSKAANPVEVQYSPGLYIDLDSVSELKNLTIGDKVNVVVKGTVKSLEQREAYEGEGKTRASICLKDFEAEIVPESTEFDGLFDEGDD